jgi:hypothetical protein
LWPSVIEQVKWSDPTFILGPFVEGVSYTSKSQESDDDSENPERLRIERKVATVAFVRPSSNAGSILDIAFDAKVSVEHIHVGRFIIDGSPYAAVTIGLKDIRLAGGFPVYWKP